MTWNQLPSGSLGAALELGLDGRVGAHRSASEVRAEERLDPLPAVVGGRDPVGGPVDGEERVAGVVVAVELVRLVVCGEDLVELVDLLRARELVLVAEQAQQRRAQVRQLVDEVGDLEREALGRRCR